MVRATIGCFAVLWFYGFFYRTVLKRWGGVARPMLERTGLLTDHPVRQVEAVGRLVEATLAQMVFALLLMLGFATPLDLIMGRGLHIDLIVLGALLGIGEFALSSILCAAVVLLAQLRVKQARAGRIRAWITQGRGGWMSQFSATVSTVPTGFMVIIVCLYVGVEEFIFRGLLIHGLGVTGAGWAIVLSLTLFVVIQAFNMPSPQGAIFPMIGAVVIGLVHGIIYWYVPILVPLIVAHITFFASAIGIPPIEEPRLEAY